MKRLLKLSGAAAPLKFYHLLTMTVVHGGPWEFYITLYVICNVQQPDVNIYLCKSTVVSFNQGDVTQLAQFQTSFVFENF